ncbi:LppX_LprAFG lipoprotein [Nocardioides sp. DS6]|uniref:LppX_LprAFG lipoprotein n=1 Tax=Nocardioides eburneus TaxID=3231482 RepID=A0ABV3SZD3_9ACTN
MSRPGSRRHGVLVGVLAAVTLVATGCGGSGGGLTPHDALAEAKKHLDDTAGVHVVLATKDLPDGVDGLEKADGVLTRAPAFKGTITAPIKGLKASVDVVAVGGKVYVKLPFVGSFQAVDPADFGVPDPATLLDEKTGISSLLPATEKVTKGDSVRGGKDNKQVLTEYSGTVPGSAVAGIISGATGDFSATYTIDGDGVLTEAVLTGHFNGTGVAANTYTVDLDDYGTHPEITAP